MYVCVYMYTIMHTLGLLTNRMLFDSIRRISNSNMSRLVSLELTYEYEPRVKFDSNLHAF